MLEIGICDDNPHVLQQVKCYLSKLSFIYPNEFIIRSYLNANEIINDILSGRNYDVIYLDIEIGDTNGIDIGYLIKQYLPEAIIVLISSYDRYYRRAFEIQPFAFIDKPLNEQVFNDIFEQIYIRIFTNDNLFDYNINKIHKRVAYNDILYFESYKRQIVLKTHTYSDVFYGGKLSDIEHRLTRKNFMRVHQSYLINYLHVVESDYTKVKMSDGLIITIPINRRNSVRDLYMDMRVRKINGEI